MKIDRRSDLNLSEIAEKCNPILRGWENYYGKYSKSSLNSIWNFFDEKIVKWIKKKYKKVKSKGKARQILSQIKLDFPMLFTHWKFRYR